MRDAVHDPEFVTTLAHPLQDRDDEAPQASLLCRMRFKAWRRLRATLALEILACVTLIAQKKPNVPGMSQYTDNHFGFSFSYPAAWEVMDEPVVNPTRNGWFSDATIVKELRIRARVPLDDQDQPHGVTIQEVLAPSGLTELGRSKSPSPVGVDEKMFLANGRWMFQTLTESPDGSPPATVPAKITRRTIGGFPIFVGAVRGGAETIVPLDGSHFLAISSLIDPGNDDSHAYLGATIVPTGPRAGQLASEQVQEQTIRREGIRLGAIGELLGAWYKDEHHVYDFHVEVIPGADPRTFAPLAQTGWITLAKDATHVYDDHGAVIPGADPKTFSTTGLLTAKDAHHTYDWRSGSLKISAVGARE
jgi:hypothetical protein